MSLRPNHSAQASVIGKLEPVYLRPFQTSLLRPRGCLARLAANQRNHQLRRKLSRRSDANI